MLDGHEEYEVLENMYDESNYSIRKGWENLTDEEIELILALNPMKKFEWERNIQRDEKGRLNKGAKLAKKDTCNENKIKLLIGAGFSVKQIVENLGCSKSTVYKIRKEYKERQKGWISKPPKL